MAVPSTKFDGRKVINAILYGDEPQTSTITGLAARYELGELRTRPTRWPELSYRLHYAKHYLRLALSVLRHG